MALELVLRNARPAGQPAGAPPVDIGIAGGRIAAIERGLRSDAEALDAGGRLVSPGLIETHIHLDKSRILDRCTPSPNRGRDHMQRVSAVKPGFTVEDVYARARTTLEACILHGATHMRTHVEVDPNVGLRGYEALQQLGQDLAWAIDLELCVFAQEGMTNVPQTDANVEACLQRGARVVGGAPAFDPDPEGQIRRVFELARAYDVDVDIHLDVGHTIDDLDIPLVCELTEAQGWGGRVAIGHGAKYSCLPPAALAELGHRLADVGVTVTVLPATDLYIIGRHQDHAVIRGVADAHALMACGANCCLSTNNVLNPFTPFGDGSLLRIANLYANTVQRGMNEELEACFEMLTERPARLLGLADYGLAVGKAADLVVWDAASTAEAVATIAPPLYGFKRGRRTFTRARPELHTP
jgi:cytosine/creatinine deaminase